MPQGCSTYAPRPNIYRSAWPSTISSCTRTRRDIKTRLIRQIDLKNDAQNGPKWLAGALENRFTIDFGRVEKCIEKKTAGGQISQNASRL